MSKNFLLPNCITRGIYYSSLHNKPALRIRTSMDPDPAFQEKLESGSRLQSSECHILQKNESVFVFLYIIFGNGKF
jgi:hypothetical protein